MKKILIFLFLVLELPAYSFGIKIGEDAPNFKLKNMEDKPVTLKQLRSGDSVVVLNFFSTDCKPCVKEMPHFKKLYRKYLKDKNVKIRIISLDENKEVLEKFIKEHDLPIPILRDPGGWKAATNYGVVTGGKAEIPQTFVIGKAGKIRKHIRGFKENVDEILIQSIEFLKKEKIKVSKSREITVIYTNSINGYLESCDCPENPFGGLVRRITAIKDLKKRYPDAILLDSGDNFPIRKNKLHAEYVLKMMGLMGYDAVGIGDQELLFGSDFLEKNINRLPFISANILACDDEKCWNLTEAYKILEVSGIKVAVLSIFNPDVFLLFPNDLSKTIKINDHMETIKGLVPPLRERADILILLSHSGNDEDKRIAEEIPGIDLIVGGHSQTLHKKPVKIKNTIIVQAGKDGHRVGRLTLKLDKNNKIKTFEHEMILLIKDIPDDETGRSLIKEYESKIKKKQKKL